jgi:hypothetical protein
MPLNGSSASSMWVLAINATWSVSHTHNFGSSYAEGKPLVQNYSENQDQASIDCHVTQYVQSGTTHNGSWPLVSGANFTSITYYLVVTNAYGLAVWETFYW